MTIIVVLFFLGGFQLFSLGMIGEYVLAIYGQVRDKPVLFERERINFPPGDVSTAPYASRAIRNGSEVRYTRVRSSSVRKTNTQHDGADQGQKQKEPGTS